MAVWYINLKEKEQNVENITFEELRDLVADKLKVDEKKVTMEASFIDDLGADSLDTVELIMSLEDKFELSISDDDAKELKTVGNVYQYLKNLS
ncbi:MAG TPA: acyl carrier protein [Candidatus Marinimicrobia bacterium]|nr:acyl carrier protein [Candidatus Neomarinimicrobiota bacterium]